MPPCANDAEIVYGGHKMTKEQYLAQRRIQRAALKARDEGKPYNPSDLRIWKDKIAAKGQEIPPALRESEDTLEKIINTLLQE